MVDAPTLPPSAPDGFELVSFSAKKGGFKSYMKNKHRGFVIHGGTPFIHSIHFNRIFPGFSHPADLGMPWFEWPLVA